MKKKLGMLMIVGSIGLLGIGSILSSPYRAYREASRIIEADLLQDDYYQAYEERCLDYVQRTYALANGGITNDTEQTRIVTSEQLIYMCYLFEKNNIEMFQKEVDFVCTYLMTENGMLAIGLEDYMIQRFSLYDQLKFFKILYKAYDKWDEEEYKNLCTLIEKQLYEQYTKEKIIYPYL